MIIALSGKKRSGKDEFYRLSKEYLETQHNLPVTRYAFADEVKLFAKTYFNVDIHDESDKERTRFILQGIGQMMREECNKDFWLDIISKAVARDDARYGVNGYVGFITDTRYRNEAAWSVAQKYLLLRILRKGIQADDPHPSEMELDDFHFDNVFYNYGTHSEYQEDVIEWLNQNVLK